MAFPEKIASPIMVDATAVESKTQQIGELGVSLVQMKEDLSDTQAALLQDQGLLADLGKKLCNQGRRVGRALEDALSRDRRHCRHDQGSKRRRCPGVV